MARSPLSGAVASLKSWRRRRSSRRRFALVTLTGESAADFCLHRDVLRHYRSFGRSFRLIDIRNYSARDNPAEVTIVDRFALFAAQAFEGHSHDSLVERLAGTRRLAFMTSDLHHWSIFPHLADSDLLERERLMPADNRTAPLFELFDRLGIRHLIASYDCPELHRIRAERPSLHTYVVDLHVDARVFRDYGLPKRHDIIVYGQVEPRGYPFRSRVVRLLEEAGRFDILRVQPGSYRYDPEICGAGLARKINQARLGLASIESFEYLVGRYFEIPACRSVVLGDLNAQGRAIFGDRYVHIDPAMSDERIVDTVAEALADRERLRLYADEMHEAIHGGFTLGDEQRKLVAIAERIAACDG